MRGASVTSTWERPSPDSAGCRPPLAHVSCRSASGDGHRGSLPGLLAGDTEPSGCGLVMATDQKRQKQLMGSLRTLSPLRFLCLSPRASRHTPSCTARPSGLIKATPSRRGYLEQRPEARDHARYVFIRTLWPQMLLRRCFFSPGPRGREMLMMFQMVMVLGPGKQPRRTICSSEGRPGGGRAPEQTQLRLPQMRNCHSAAAPASSSRGTTGYN